MSSIQENQRYNNLFFITFKIINDLPVFVKKEYYDIILNSLTYLRKNKLCKIYAYAILRNHIHLVLKTTSNHNLDEFVRNFKSYTGKLILSQLNKENQFDILKEMEMSARNTKKQNYKVWRKNIWPKSIVTEKFLLQKIKYTDLNPLRHNIVKDIEKYSYTSYHNHFCSHQAALEIDDYRGLL